MRGRLISTATVVALVVGLAGMGGAATAQPPAGLPTEPVRSDAVSTYTVRASDPSGDAGALAQRLVELGYDVVDRDGSVVSVIGPSSVADRLTAEPGVEVVGSTPYPVGDVLAEAPPSQDDILPRRLDGRTYPTFYGGYRTAAGYRDFAAQLPAAYPKLVGGVGLGSSWTHQFPIYGLCITADAEDGCDQTADTEKARFLIIGQTHARELTTSEIAWRFITYLVDGYRRRPEVTALLDSTEVYIVSQVNPDGAHTVEQGIRNEGFGAGSRAWQRKNVDDTYSVDPCEGPWESSQEGIDLNRNFDVDWGRVGTSTDPCDLTYGGPEPASEPETIGQVELMADLFPDQRGTGDEPAPPTATGAMLTLHSYGNQVLLPWGFTTQHAPNDAGLRSYAFRMAYFNGFEAGQAGEILYSSSGATDDWLYDRLGVAAFTWEIGADSGTCGGFFPEYSCQEDLWKQNLDALMYAASAAGKPYEQALGPTTVRTTAVLGDGGRVRVRATADDDAYGENGVDRPAAQDVVAGRLFLGQPGAHRTPMTVRGSGTRVGLHATVRPGLERRLVYVQARDADGHWGPKKATWVPAST